MILAFKHALEMITRNGGKLEGNKVSIATQSPKAVKFEKSFPDMFPVEKRNFKHENIKEIEFEFTGTGFILRGEAMKKNKNASDYVFEVELYIDGKKMETSKLPTDFTTRRLELFWKYHLPNKKYDVRIKVLNPNEDYDIHTTDYIVYGNEPLKKNKY